MNYWFITYIILNVLGLGVALARDGEPRKENYSFFTTLISTAVHIFIIYKAIKAGF